MVCNDRQLTQAQLEAGFQNQRTGVQKAIRPFSGEATPESLADYLNKEVFPVLQQARAKLNEVFLQVVDNAPSGNPLAFYFSDETANADPTAGRIRLDAATQNTATTMRVSQENGRLVDVAPWLDVMAGGATSPLGTITLFDAINPGRFIRWDLDTMTDQGAYWDLGITVIESSHDNPFVDGEGVVISFIPGVSAAGSTVPVTSLSPVAAETFIGNFTAAPAAPTARAGSDIAGTGLAYAAGGTLSVDATLAEILANGNTTDANDIHVSTGQQLIFDVGGDALGDIQSLGVLNVRTASTVDMRAATGNFGLSASAGNFNMSGTNQLNFTASAASGFIRFTTNGTARLIIAGDGSWQLAGDDGTTGELLQSQGATSPPIWGTAVTASYTDGSVTLPKIATQAAGTVLANVTAGAASPTAHALSTLAGSGLTYTNVTGVIDVDDVALTALADQADDTFLANISGGAAPPTAVALTTLAGAGLTGGANAVLAVGAGDGIDVNADDVAVDVTDIIDNVTITEVATNNIQRAALTGFAAASAGSNATTSAEPIVTYSASANMSAERVTTSSTSITVSTSVASQIEFQRAALTGDVTASANSNATTIANDAVTNAKAANMAQDTIKGRASGAGTGDPTDLTATQVVDILETTIEGRSFSFTADQAFLARTTLNEEVLIGGLSSNSTNGQINDLDVSGLAVVRFTAADLLTGMDAGGSRQLMLLLNANSTDDVLIGIEHASSVAANRFAGAGTSRALKPGEMAIAFYDDTSSRWFMTIRDDIAL